MAEKTVCISQQQTRSIKVLKWKVRKGQTVPNGHVLLLYYFEGAEKLEQHKLKSGQAGTILRMVAQEGAIVKHGEILLELKECLHPTIMNDMCAECGADLRNNEISTTASVPMVHTIPDLKVSEEQARIIGKADSERLIKDRKLVLLVDLDQTLIHTTNDNIPPNLKDVYHFQLNGQQSSWYHTRLRPNTHSFLNNVFPFFELHICTFGARNYAHTIAMFLDPDQKFFSSRILSRDECFDATSKKANLKALFPCGDNMVCIIDDREDVWSHAKNLIHVKPYHFFQHTGDINAPPGLDKHENDDKVGVDLTKIVEKKSDNKSDEDSTKIKNKKVEENNDKADEELTITKEKKVEENGDKKQNNDQENGTNVNNGCVKKDCNTSKQEETENGKTKEETKSKHDDNLLEIEDPDDYLIYLEDILKRIHQTFYDEFDKMESGKVPDLKQVIPFVRNKVLQGTKLVFSGLVPTHIKLEQSKAYQVARSLGAEVTQDLEDDTTHLVAVRPGTAKVNAGKRKKNLKIVTSDWLWSCAERWERVEEKIFILNNKGSKNRHPPPHCSPEHNTNYSEHSVPAMRKRTPSGRFMDTINPLMSFSTADIADMDKEVEDILDDESDSSEEAEENIPETAMNNESSSTTSDESEPEVSRKGSKRRNTTSLCESPTKLMKPPVDLDLEESQNSESDDEELNILGASIERDIFN